MAARPTGMTTTPTKTITATRRIPRKKVTTTTRITPPPRITAMRTPTPMLGRAWPTGRSMWPISVMP